MTKINQFLEPADPQTIHQIINELVEGEARELAKMVMDLKNPKIGWVYFIDVGQSDAGHEWAVWIKDDIFMVPRSDIVSNISKISSGPL